MLMGKCFLDAHCLVHSGHSVLEILWISQYVEEKKKPAGEAGLRGELG
jgi:hypothetical protein